MKNFFAITMVFTLILLGVCFGNSTLAKSPIEAISIEQYFNDGKNRSGTNVYVNGSIVEWEIIEDAFSDKKEISWLWIKQGLYKIQVFFMKNEPLKNLKMGDKVTVKFESGNLISGFNFVQVKGKLFRENISISKWSSKDKPNLPDLITVEDYFAKKLRYQETSVTLEGTIYKMSTSQAGIVIFDFVSGSNNAIVQMEPKHWKKKETRVVLKTLKEGDRIQLKGSFVSEGNFTLFFGETLRKK